MWSTAAHDRAPSRDGGYMWFLLSSRSWHNLRPGGATRGKWRIPDGKGGEWYVFMFRAPKVVAPTCVNYGPHRLGPKEQALIMYLCIRD
jgi:hypothetical protein